LGRVDGESEEIHARFFFELDGVLVEVQVGEASPGLVPAKSFVQGQKSVVHVTEEQLVRTGCVLIGCHPGNFSGGDGNVRDRWAGGIANADPSGLCVHLA
jgi:hypothetical protein